MKIALLGYGKMGRFIEGLAEEAGDEVVLRVDEHNRSSVTAEDLGEADVAIEFSRPDAAVANIDLALAAGVPIVVGTTGWLKELPAVTQTVEQHEGGLFWASNFSIGVNIFFATARRLSQLAGEFADYDASIEETHHTEKLDAPSGTAITLAEVVTEELPAYYTSHAPNKANGKSVAPSEAAMRDIPVVSHRKAGVPGTHVLRLASKIDTIELTHTAHSREGFARGALTAARWLIGKRGVFTMSDLLQLK